MADMGAAASGPGGLTPSASRGNLQSQHSMHGATPETPGGAQQQEEEGEQQQQQDEGGNQSGAGGAGAAGEQQGGIRGAVAAMAAAAAAAAAAKVAAAAAGPAGGAGAGKFVCQQCGKVVNSEGGLKKHMLIHGDKNFNCPFPGCTRVSGLAFKKGQLQALAGRVGGCLLLLSLSSGNVCPSEPTTATPVSISHSLIPSGLHRHCQAEQAHDRPRDREEVEVPAVQQGGNCWVVFTVNLGA